MGEEENSVPPRVTIVNRRNTSTDDNFLSSSPVNKQEPVQFTWPPRFPSQESEDLSQLYHPSQRSIKASLVELPTCCIIASNIIFLHYAAEKNN